MLPCRLHPLVRSRALLCALALSSLAACDGNPAGPTATTEPAVRFAVAAPVPARPMIDAGNGFTCALAAAGAVSCWGSNSYGERSVPADLGTVVQVTTGDGHACALESAGTVVCWGRNEYGQSDVPADLTGVVQISAGGFHTCAVDGSGTLVCWGANTSGQATVPPELGPVTQVSGGRDNSCALRTNGTVACWGWSSGGVAVPPTLSGVVEVSVGSAHSCAVRAERTVACWGSVAGSSDPVAAGLVDVVQLSSGYNHDCVARSDESAFCWGSNGSGQTAVPIDLAHVAQVTGGFNHSCALTSDGAVHCWGSNTRGQSSVPAGLNLLLPQTIAFTSAPSAPSIGGSYALAATGGGSGNPVTFSSLTPSVCSVDRATVSFLAVGTCTVAADQAGAPMLYQDAAQATQETAVQPAPQSITFTTTPPNPAYAGTAYAIGAAGGKSGNGITFSTLTPAVCSVAGNSVSLLVVGMCTVAADQAGNGDYLAATQVTQSILVSKQPQEITFTSSVPSPVLLGASATVAATGGGSGNPVALSSLSPSVCSLSGSTVSFVGIGTCLIAANQAGNASYAAAPQATQSIGVVYPFTGFLGAVVNAPALNTARAGSTISLEFSLGGDRGPGVLGAGSPTIVSLPGCGTTPSGLESPAVVPNRSLTFNKRSGNYTVSFGSDRSWAASCRQVVVRLSDGTDHRVNFQFVK